MATLPAERVETFWTRVQPFLALDACWLWTGSRDGKGYGYYSWQEPGKGARIASAHRTAYELLVGPIPEGLELDHLCRNTLCVNPDHLEPVTHQVNMTRAARRKPCGHSPALMVTTKSGTRCSHCARLRSIEHRRRRR